MQIFQIKEICLYVSLCPTIFSEPIIAPVKKKKFSMAEQDLPDTVYNME